MSYEDTKLIVQALSEHRLRRDPDAPAKCHAAFLRGTVVTKATPQVAVVTFAEMQRQARIEQERETKRVGCGRRARAV